MRVALGALLAGAWLGCAAVPVAPPTVEPEPAPPTAVTQPPPAPEPAEAVVEVPTIPAGEVAQKKLLSELETRCALHRNLYRLPNDLHAAQCRTRLSECEQAIDGLAVLSSSPHAKVRGDALFAAATIHNHNDCGSLRNFHPCDMEREHPGQHSELCASLRWVPDALAEGVGAEDPEVRYGALRGLSTTSVPHEVAVPVLHAFLRDVEPSPDVDTRARWTLSAAIGGLRRFTSNAAEALPELKRLLELGPLFHPQVHAELIATVEAIGDAASSAKPLIIAALRDRRPRVRRAAVQALARLGEPEDRRLIIPLLADPDPDVARAAQFARDRLHGSRSFPRF